MPFFSLDGQWVGFFILPPEEKLKKVSVQGGAPVTICDAPLKPGGASWGDDDFIVFSTSACQGLRRVPAAGGEVETLTTVDTAAGEG